MTVPALKKLEQVVNELIQLDEDNYIRLNGFDGKKIAIEISGFDFIVYLRLTKHGIEIHSECDGGTDVTIRASALTFLQLVIRGNGEHTVTPGDMEIIGDVGLAQQFQKILLNLEIDWEEYISKWTGDYTAHKAGNFFRDARKYMKDTSEMIGMDISEYLRYEKEQLPDQSEVNEFISAVDMIRNDVERLQHRLMRIDNKLFTEAAE